MFILNLSKCEEAGGRGAGENIFTLASCLLPLAYCLLPIAYCLLPIASCLLLLTQMCEYLQSLKLLLNSARQQS
ncbi:hypothetical protein FJR09_04105 [Dolichospermum sp. UHCC 0406]|nr:hypothetical protein [Dolichospermum sp. UHCC 0299]MTJ38039.1 hypothetical protein [Dolichospermum sp. UHCC 0406]